MRLASRSISKLLLVVGLAASGPAASGSSLAPSARLTLRVELPSDLPARPVVSLKLRDAQESAAAPGTTVELHCAGLECAATVELPSDRA